MNKKDKAPFSRGLKIGKDEFLAILCCFIWGSCPSVTKISYAWYGIANNDVKSMMFMAGIRFMISGLLVIAFQSARSRSLLRPQKSDLTAILAVGIVQTALQYGLYFPGIANSLGVRISVLCALSSFFVMILASFFFKEKMTVLKIIGCAIGIAGVAYMSLSGGAINSPATFMGEGLVVISTIAFSFGSILSKKFSLTTDPATLTSYQLIAGGFILAVLGGFMGGSMRPEHFWQYGGLLYLAMASAFCYTVWTSLFKRNEAYHVSSFKLTEPIFGVVISAIVLAEAGKVDWIKCVIALILVSAGILISNRPQRSS